jgi:hypothetical protein
MAIVYVLCKYLVLKSITRGVYIYGSFYLTMLVMIKAWAKYVFISLAPIVLTHNHEISPGIYSYVHTSHDFDKFAVLSQSVFDLRVLLSLGVLGGIFFAAVRAWKRRPLVTFCIGWFFVSILPASNIVPRNLYFAEGYLYHGLWGFCLLLGMCCESMLRRGGTVWRMPWRRVGIGLICLLTVFYGVRTWIRNTDFRDNIVLFERAVRAGPRHALAHKELGGIYLLNGMHDKARASFERARQLRPDDPITLNTIEKSPVFTLYRDMYTSCPEARVSAQNQRFQRQ